MPDIASHVIKLFADDSKLIATIRNFNDLTLLQQDLNALTKWYLADAIQYREM
jgi:hypothetical protein